jgi:predicted nuclease of predicted toxin-antitoxin system
MRFLIDAQLPKRLGFLLTSLGYDVIHTLDLPQKNATPDEEINRISLEESRIVVSKDRDFLDSILINQKPYKLLFVTTGNISNNQLIELFKNNIVQIVHLFETNYLLEINPNGIVIHY